jgi:dihydrofolate reductase
VSGRSTARGCLGVPSAAISSFGGLVTRLSVYIACSLDGYIATPDDSLDWLEQSALPGEDYGYDAFMSSVDGVAMGRGTYAHIAHLDPLPFGERKVFVFTGSEQEPRNGVTFWRPSPREALATWESMRLERLYVDGGLLISAFLAEGLIDDLSITVVPLLLGDGRPLFHPSHSAVGLTLTGIKHWPSGLVNLSYMRPISG